MKENFSQLQKKQNFLLDFNITAFKRNQNLKDLLVHASLKGNKKKNVFFKKETFIYNQYTGLGAPLNENLHPESSNLVYIIECKHCHKLYVGQTKNTLNERLKQHIYCIEKNRKIGCFVQTF